MLLPPLFFLVIIAFLVEATHSLHPHTYNASDEQALLAFKSAIQYDQNNSFITWTSNVSFCNWNGVTCALRRHRTRVVSLNISSVGLEGTVSPFLANLSFLRTLDLNTNGLHGHIPSQLGSLPRLRTLNLYTNQLVGSIPAALSACSSLRNLDLSRNHLTGNIPSALGLLPKLEKIALYRNNLTGIVPNTFGNLSFLSHLHLQENNLTGQIPPELGMLSQLSELLLGSNHFTGQIPSSLSNCTSLQAFDTIFNDLSGEIPGQLCAKNTLLRHLQLSASRLSGRIPDTLFNCSQLQELGLWGNQLTGIMPTELGKLHALTRIYLWGNHLVSGTGTGSTTSLPILTALTNCSLLNILDLSHNQLTGVIPSLVGQLSPKLEFLNLAFNNLTGPIPPQIGNLTNLTQLAFGGNLHTGTIPPTIGMLQRLERLYLALNNLQGHIPMEIGKLTSLGLLVLEKNNLSGNIPDSLAHLQQIRWLSLSHNQLTGNIPASLGECLKLEALDLSYNRFSGHIPPQVAAFPDLVIYLNFSNNLLRGPLPSELSKMDKVLAIDISGNHLTGQIPYAIGSCMALEYLNISSNQLKGPIPDSLGKLQNLRDLDLSSNNLVGTVPMSLGKLRVLQHLNVTTNNLSGEVPKDGVFKNLDTPSFIGNLGLCGPWVHLPPCPAPKQRSLKHLKNICILIGTAVFVTWCVLMGFLWRRYCNRHPLTSQPFELGPQRISFQEILAATDELNENNLLGIGSFGKVYKGVLREGTMVAIKILNVQNEDVSKSFDRECNVLSKVRHRNLLRIITSYSDPEFKALIFPLVPNGSLNKFLYPVGGQSSNGQVYSLDLIQRLSIAIDIAQGMEYLHHHCFVQVIHCDLKPENVLLGEDMTAYLTDFGISKVCIENSMDSRTSTSSLKGSIGYIAPEYGVSRGVTTKGDVYSYGILLLEMLTMKKPTDNMFVEGMNLQKWVSRGFPDTIEQVVDSHLLNAATNNDKDELLNCLKQLICVGLLCTKESPGERPSMIDIVRILHSIKNTFFGAASTSTFHSDLSHFLTNTNIVPNNDESQTSSTF